MCGANTTSLESRDDSTLDGGKAKERCRVGANRSTACVVHSSDLNPRQTPSDSSIIIHSPFFLLSANNTSPQLACLPQAKGLSTIKPKSTRGKHKLRAKHFRPICPPNKRVKLSALSFPKHRSAFDRKRVRTQPKQERPDAARKPRTSSCFMLTPFSERHGRWPQRRCRYEFRLRQACRPLHPVLVRLPTPAQSWRRCPRPLPSPSAARGRRLFSRNVHDGGWKGQVVSGRGVGGGFGGDSVADQRNYF